MVLPICTAFTYVTISIVLISYVIFLIAITGIIEYCYIERNVIVGLNKRRGKSILQIIGY